MWYLLVFQKCVSAKHSGMRFQGWREPKPLRSRCSSAVLTEELDKCNTERLKSARRSAREKTDVEKEMVDRLSQPTKSSIWKTSSARAREVGTDMNYYSWSRMNVYKDYQKVLYGDNGAVKQINKGKARWSYTRLYAQKYHTNIHVYKLFKVISIHRMSARNLTYKERDLQGTLLTRNVTYKERDLRGTWLTRNVTYEERDLQRTWLTRNVTYKERDLVAPWNLKGEILLCYMLLYSRNHTLNFTQK